MALAAAKEEKTMSIASLFDYDREAPLDIRKAGTREQDGAVILNLTYASPFDRRRAAYLVTPQGVGPFAAILYVHWYEPQSPDSNRTQFLEEATLMARRGAASLLIETLWSDRDWFIKRTQDDDYEDSVRQVIELRQAMDLLLAQPGVNAGRLAFVGHDFGAMYGVLMGRVDPRPACYALMAGTPRFPDWFLYYPPLEGAAREAFVERMAALDPIQHVAKLSPAPLLFQFARDDPHVPQERAEAFYEAAGEPKQIQWYDAGHGLNEQATRDRMAWLGEQLGLAQG
jgi:dienelactone hydrolase